MPFTLLIDTSRWRRHLDGVRDVVEGLVPVVKGNGYGFGLSRLAEEATRLGVDTVAVGEAGEVEAVREHFAHDVLVLSPYRPWDDPAPHPQVVRTVSDVDGLTALAGTGSRVVVELLTRMVRHGLGPDDLREVPGMLDGLQCEGFALHLPMDEPSEGRVSEVVHWAEVLDGPTVPRRVLWVSHLSDDELAEVRRRCPDWTLRPRIGTRLWLGDRDALEARGTVLDVHRLARGDRYGYRQHRARRDGWLLVVAGGTAHGVGLEAPKPVRGVVSRAKVLAIGMLGASGRALSPFTWAGRRRWFAEPPHMQVSMLWLPDAVTPPKIGDTLACDVRMTTTHVDAIEDS
ncbi:MAG: alanine racemase [Actinomycetes bacterium]